MQTWLDDYIERLVQTWDQLVGPKGLVREINGPEIAGDVAAYARTRGQSYRDRLDIVRRLAYRLTVQANDPAFVARSERLGGASDRSGAKAVMPWVIETLCFQEVLPFLGRGPGAPGWPQQFTGRPDIDIEAITALQPDAPLIRTLADARSPADREGYLDRALAEGGTWYIDLPHKSVLLGDTEVRAVFLMPALKAGYRVTAVLTHPATNTIKGRMLWPLGNPDGNYGYTLTGARLGTAAEQVNDLVRLLVLYRAATDRDQRTELPRMDAQQLDRSPRRIPQNRKKTSLFRVERLAAPADQLGRRLTAGQAAWTLGWRTEVSGHFKLQPHGVGRSLRKLIWIDSYQRGPEDAPHKVTLERLSDFQQARSVGEGVRNPEQARSRRLPL